ncbi:MAG TPA: hypothetical protein DG757_18700 [Bacillus sp. (in: Bacteria)]|nr:hypothetical protein [Bacillus sp. (in: firmicutes)]
MKFKKFTALALAYTGMVPAMVTEREAIQQETIKSNLQENIEISNREEYLGSDSLKWVRSILASYTNQPLVGGEFKNSLQVGTSIYDIDITLQIEVQVLQIGKYTLQ